MSLLDCINNAEKEGPGKGGLTKEQAEKARELFINFKVENETKGGMGPAAADAKAGSDTFDVLKYEAAQKKKRMILQRATQKRVMNDINSFTGKNKGEAMVALLERDGTGRSGYSNVVARQNAIRGIAHGMIDNILGQLRKTQVVGRTTSASRAKSQSMVREIFGENTGDQAARELAQAWGKAAEWLRVQFNKAGGDIPKRTDWGMPQSHDNAAIRKAGSEAWLAFIKPLLDPEKMVSFKTGKPMGVVEFDEVLAEVYETIATDGFARVKETSVGGQGKSLSKRRQDHRFLVFKDADSWLTYQEKYGGGDVFSMIMDHIDGMSKDIGLLEILGPNPTSTILYLKTQLTKEAKALGQPANAAAKLNRPFSEFDNIYNYITGKTHRPVSEGVARTFAGLGNLLTSALLGSTSILALATDPNYTRITKRMAGMNVFKSSLKQSFKMMTANNTTKQQAIRMGLIAENWSSVAYGQSRYASETLGDNVTERIAQASMNISLLSPFTQAGRWAFGMEFMGFIADNAAKPFAELNPAFKDTLRRYGITEGDWSKMGSFEQYDFKGAKFLRPDDMLDKDRALSFKMLEMVQGMTNLAVPVASARGRALLVGKSEAGTMAGEIIRSFAMFKNFPMTFYLNNVKATLSQEGIQRKASIAGDLLITSTAMAALSIQLRETAGGKDPLPMDTPQFWGRALLSSGGLGIFGDFLFADVNRFGGGLAQTIAGPRMGFLDKLRELTVGNIMQLATGKDTNFGRESVDFFGRYLPGVSTWYLRLAFERLVLDRLRLMADPKAKQRMRSLERRRKRIYDQDYWWRPGETSPRRGPNIQGVMGQ